MVDSIAEKQIQDLRSSLDTEIKKKQDLQKKLDEQYQEMQNIMKYADTLIIEFTSDFRIINTLGPIEKVFGQHSKKVERGANLMQLIYKTTQNIKAKEENEEEVAYEDREDIEKKVEKFIQGKKDDLLVEIIGENDEAEIFLFVWQIIRNNKNFKSYIKIIPTNNIVKITQDKFKKDLERIDKNNTQLLRLLKEGIVILDRKYKISFMNEAAKKILISSKIPLLQDAPVEGRFFREIFVHEEVEDINQRLEYIDQAIDTKQNIVYTKRTRDIDVEFSIFPMLDDSNYLNNIAIIVTNKSYNIGKASDDANSKKRLLITLKQLSDEKNILSERVKELEYNHKWFMKKRKEDIDTISNLHNSIKSLNNYLNNLPVPTTILRYPELTYEFVNRSFEVLFNQKREIINGKTDFFIFSDNDVEKLNFAVDECVYNRNITTIIIHGVKIIQAPIFDKNENISQIIRIYEE